MNARSPLRPDDLERALSDMTTWKRAEPGLWKKALDSSDAASRGSRRWRPRRVMGEWVSKRLLLTGVGCIALVLIVGMMLPSLGRARMSARRSFAVAADSTFSDVMDTVPSVDAPVAARAGPNAIRAPHQAVETWGQNNNNGYPLPSQPPASSIAQPAAPQRYVVQKATMTLQTDDVRAAFAKAARLVSEAGGEFVENSSLTGDGKSAQGNMTLRVAASRIGEVMNKLRELGVVKSENTTGEDVTTQVVDVEARIRNEQRVEMELLELLEKRNDAPLKDVLELRSSLSSVRQSIEQLLGQRDRLGRLVSLASILVVIRAEPSEIKPLGSSIGDYFTKNVDQAWRGGVRYLSDTVAWLIAVAIGGIVWWTVLAIVIVSIVRWRRRLSARCV